MWLLILENKIKECLHEKYSVFRLSYTQVQRAWNLEKKLQAGQLFQEYSINLKNKESVVKILKNRWELQTKKSFFGSVSTEN